MNARQRRVAKRKILTATKKELITLLLKQGKNIQEIQATLDIKGY